MVNASVIQMKMGENREANIDKAEAMVRKAASDGGEIVLLPELFEGFYFCKDMDKKYFSWARERKDNPVLLRFSQLAKELGVVLPISYFEKSKEH